MITRQLAAFAARYSARLLKGSVNRKTY